MMTRPFLEHDTDVKGNRWIPQSIDILRQLTAAAKQLCDRHSCRGDNGKIFRAKNGFKWPGQASVFASMIFISRTPTQAQCILDDLPVAAIGSYLDAAQVLTPFKLAHLDIRLTEGIKIHGEGFLIDNEIRTKLIASAVFS